MHEPDAQTRAFADATPDDLAEAGEQTLLAAATVHHSDNHEGVMTPQEWDAAGWDAERADPKSVEEARASLAARIADPSAPDGPEVTGTYGEMEGR